MNLLSRWRQPPGAPVHRPLQPGAVDTRDAPLTELALALNTDEITVTECVRAPAVQAPLTTTRIATFARLSIVVRGLRGVRQLVLTLARADRSLYSNDSKVVVVLDPARDAPGVDGTCDGTYAFSVEFNSYRGTEAFWHDLAFRRVAAAARARPEPRDLLSISKPPPRRLPTMPGYVGRRPEVLQLARALEEPAVRLWSAWTPSVDMIGVSLRGRDGLAALARKLNRVREAFEGESPENRVVARACLLPDLEVWPDWFSFEVSFFVPREPREALGPAEAERTAQALAPSCREEELAWCCPLRPTSSTRLEMDGQSRGDVALGGDRSG